MTCISLTDSNGSSRLYLAEPSTADHVRWACCTLFASTVAQATMMLSPESSQKGFDVPRCNESGSRSKSAPLTRLVRCCPSISARSTLILPFCQVGRTIRKLACGPLFLTLWVEEGCPEVGGEYSIFCSRLPT